MGPCVRSSSRSKVEKLLQEVIKEYKAKSPAFRKQVHLIMRASYSHSLLDMLKETALRTGFPDVLTPVASRERLPRDVLHRRLLLCLYGLGTNTGFKRLPSADPGTTYSDLRYARSRYIHKEQLRNAIAHVASAIFAIRRAEIWGEGTTACASDSKKFGAWDQNLLTEWHVRYRGPGVLIYWHVERKSTCIYSQLKSCSSRGGSRP
jgi:Tn3 transposase DDE domain-containing protein